MVLRRMDELHIGDRVMLGGRVFLVRGISPMSIVPCRVHLEDAETGEEVEADADDLQAEEPINRRRDEPTRASTRTIAPRNSSTTALRQCAGMSPDCSAPH